VDWVVDILKTYGLAGVVIFVLAGVVMMLWKRIGEKDADLAKLNAERATERETLVKLIEGGNASANATANATETRNEIMDDLAKAITSQANAVERYNDSVKNQADMLKDKFIEFKHVVDAFGESNRVSTGLLSDLRNALAGVQNAVNQMGAEVARRA
jgi:methyl-accepting chemotaxis protein